MAEAAEREGVGAGTGRARRQTVGGRLAFAVITVDGHIAVVVAAVGAVLAGSRRGRGAVEIEDAVAVVTIGEAVAIVVGEIAAAGLETERAAAAAEAGGVEVAIEVEAVHIEVAVVITAV